MRIKGAISPQNNGAYTSFMRYCFLSSIFQGTRSSGACRENPGLPTWMEGAVWSPYDGCWQQPVWRLVDVFSRVFTDWCSQLSSVRDNLTCMWKIKAAWGWLNSFVQRHCVCSYLVPWLTLGMQTQWHLEFIRSSFSLLKWLIIRGQNGD